VVPYTFWYGARAYSAAVAATGTQKALDLRRVSDNATCTALIGKNGNLDLTVGTPCNSNIQTVTAWIGASTARVTKMYDQTNGNACGGASCDVAQATAGNQPLLLLTGCGGGGTLPCIQIGPSQGNGELDGSNSITPSVPGSLSAVGNRAVLTQQTFFISFLVSNNKYILAHGANVWDCDGVGATATDAAWHAANCTQNTGIGQTTINIDGTEVTGQSTPNTTAGAPALLNTLGDSTTQLLGEAGYIDNVQINSSQRTALCHNQRLYWDTGGSC
jgi:hypothetical protein